MQYKCRDLKFKRFFDLMHEPRFLLLGFLIYFCRFLHITSGNAYVILFSQKLSQYWLKVISVLLAGYPKEFVAHFLDGFPDDWHAIISRFFITYV